VLAENTHPFDEKPIGINNPYGLLPECEELVSVSAEKAVPGLDCGHHGLGRCPCAPEANRSLGPNSGDIRMLGLLASVAQRSNCDEFCRPALVAFLA